MIAVMHVLTAFTVLKKQKMSLALDLLPISQLQKQMYRAQYTHTQCIVSNLLVCIDDIFAQFAVCDEDDDYDDEAPSSAPQSMQSVQVKGPSHSL